MKQQQKVKRTFRKIDTPLPGLARLGPVYSIVSVDDSGMLLALLILALINMKKDDICVNPKANVSEMNAHT